MRIMLLAALLPGALAAQSVPARVRAPGAAVLPSGTVQDGVILRDRPVQSTDDMPAPALHLVDSAPTLAVLSWNPIVGASGYVVYRNDLGPLNSPPLPLTTTSFAHRADNDYRVAYTYRVVALYPNGHTGTSAPITYVPPRPPVPTEFRAELVGRDIVFAWSLPGAYEPDRFMLFGPGLGEGVAVPGNKYTYTLDGSIIVDQQLRGTLEYTVAAMFAPGNVTPPASEWPREQVAFFVARYRITMVGFTAHETTNDDAPWHRDGKGDEIFLAAAVRHYERSTAQLLTTRVLRTRVYGERARFPDRILAGSIPGGGIQRGDAAYPAAAPTGVPSDSALPLVLWEDVLYPDDVLILRPAVFEFDHLDADRSCYLRWRRELSTRIELDTGSRLYPLTHELSLPIVVSEITNRLERGGARAGIPFSEQCAADQGLGLDRFIGFTAAKLERFLQYGLVPELEYVGSVGPYYSSGGRYGVRLRIERLPDAPVQAVRR